MPRPRPSQHHCTETQKQTQTEGVLEFGRRMANGRTNAVSGVNSLGFMTIVQPHARAGATFQALCTSDLREPTNAVKSKRRRDVPHLDRIIPGDAGGADAYPSVNCATRLPPPPLDASLGGRRRRRECPAPSGTDQSNAQVDHKLRRDRAPVYYVQVWVPRRRERGWLPSYTTKRYAHLTTDANGIMLRERKLGLLVDFDTLSANN